MRRVRSLAAVLLTLAMPVLSACSMMGKASRGEEVTVVVENNLRLPSPVTVWVYSDVGDRRLLGPVNPGRTTPLRFRAGNITGSYRLVAIINRTNSIASQPVSLNGGETVNWQLLNNVALVAR